MKKVSLIFGTLFLTLPIMPSFAVMVSGTVSDDIDVMPDVNIVPIYSNGERVPNLGTSINAEGYFIMAPDRVGPVPLHPGVKIEPDVFLAVIMIDRHAVGIVVVTQYRQHTALLIFQDLNTFRLGNLLFKAKHFSKHAHFLLLRKGLRARIELIILCLSAILSR